MIILPDISASEFSRWFLAAFFIVVAIFYTVRICLGSRPSGRSPVTPGPPGSRHFAVHTVFRLFRAAILVVCVLRVPWPELDAWLGPLEALWRPWLLITGNLLLLLSFSALLYVHFYMAENWRSGIDDQGTGPLITTGPFALSRNPMFTLVQLGQLGLFLSLPSVFTLICLIVGVGAIQVQVRLEEEHLAKRHGQAYRAYRARVPRWLWRP